MSTDLQTETKSIVEQYADRQSWLNARRSMIGSSDVPAIFGVGYANQSPATIWYSKIGDDVTENDEETEKRMRIGKILEPALSDIFVVETGLQVIDPGEFTIYRHPALSWLGSTLDRQVIHDDYGEIPLELKAVNYFNRNDWTGEPPLKFQVQVQQQMAVTGASHAYLMGLIGGDEPVIKLIERNQRFIDAMIVKLLDFWGFVERRELPPVDESEATAKVLAKLWPKDSGESVQLPPESMQWDAELVAAKATAKAAEATIKSLENKIKASIGSATDGVLPSGERYTWKHQSRKGYVVNDSEFRVLRRAKSNGDNSSE